MKKFKGKIFKGNARRYYSVVSLLFAAFIACFWLSFVDKQGKQEDFQVVISSSDLFIDFLDVGSADCTLLHTDKSLIMIDAGLINSELSIPDYIEKEIFKKRNLKTIDLMVLTHPHADHYGQMEKVLDKFETKRFITSKSSVDKDNHLRYNKLLKKLEQKNIKVEYSKAKSSIKINDEINIDILGPIKMDNNNVNNNSVVLKIEYNGVKFLFPGDAEREEEKDIINSGQDLRVDVLKAGHHGSLTSSSKKFLELTGPKYVIISARNKKHVIYPHKEVAKRLSVLGIPYFSTQDFGTIRFSVDRYGKLHVPDYGHETERKAA